MIALASVTYYVAAVLFAWNLDQAVQETWGVGLKLIMLLIVFILPAFQYWISYYRELFLQKEPGVFEKYITSFLVPLAPIGYNFYVLIEGRVSIIGYALVVAFGVMTFRFRAKFFSRIVPIDRKPGDIDFFRKFPPSSESDFGRIKILGVIFLLFPLFVSAIHR